MRLSTAGFAALVEPGAPRDAGVLALVAECLEDPPQEGINTAASTTPAISTARRTAPAVRETGSAGRPPSRADAAVAGAAARPDTGAPPGAAWVGASAASADVDAGAAGARSVAEPGISLARSAGAGA